MVHHIYIYIYINAAASCKRYPPSLPYIIIVQTCGKRWDLPKFVDVFSVNLGFSQSLIYIYYISIKTFMNQGFPKGKNPLTWPSVHPPVDLGGQGGLCQGEIGSHAQGVARWFRQKWEVSYKNGLPSGELTVCNWKWLFIVDFPIKNGDFPLLC